MHSTVFCIDQRAANTCIWSLVSRNMAGEGMTACDALKHYNVELLVQVAFCCDALLHRTASFFYPEDALKHYNVELLVQVAFCCDALLHRAASFFYPEDALKHYNVELLVQCRATSSFCPDHSAFALVQEPC